MRSDHFSILLITRMFSLNKYLFVLKPLKHRGLFFIYSYVEHEHIRHCVPSNVSSGLANLPLDYIWVDGKENKSAPTDPFLPTGEKLSGARVYSQIMSYFTTNAMTPLEVHELGKKQLSILYPMVSLQNNNNYNYDSFFCKISLIRIFKACTKTRNTETPDHPLSRLV